MPAYAFVELTIHDRDKMAEYIDKVSDTIVANGGRYLIRTPEVEVLEGTAGEHPMKVLLEFPDAAAIRRWYDSPDYQAILPNRLAHSDANFMIIEGV